MPEMNWKTGVLMVIVAVGLLFEFFKHSPGLSTAHLWEKENLPNFATILRPYSVKDATAKRNRISVAQTHPIHVAALDPALESQVQKFVAANAPQTTEIEHKDKGAEGKDKKKKNDDEWEIFTDPKTGKRYRRRKKKPVAAQESKTPEVTKTADTSADNHDSNDIPALVDQVVVSGQVAPVAASDKDNFVSLEEWERRLLSQPDAAATRLFIQQYQTNLVTPDTFYKIVKMMAEDSRTEMKQLAVMCATLTPSISSFEILAELQKSENSGSKLRGQVDTALDRYADISNLSVLQTVLHGTDNYNLVIGTQKLDLAANRYLKPASGTTAKTSVNAIRFQPFLTTLKPLTTSHDSTVASQAASTLADLQNLLGASSHTTSTAQTNGPQNSNLATTQGP